MDNQSSPSTLDILKGQASAPADASSGATPPKKGGSTKGGKASKAKVKTEHQPTEDADQVNPPAVQAVNGEILQPDLLTDAVKEIEGLTEEAAKPMVKELLESNDFNFFKIGGVLTVILDKKWYAPHKDFKTFVEEEYGFSSRKAFYYMEIYAGLCHLDLPWSVLKAVGWSKLKELLPVISKDNADEWLAKAGEMTVLKLGQAVAKAKKEQEGGDASEGASKPAVAKTFKLHDDQAETVNEALAKAKQVGKTEVDSVALELMALDYLAKPTPTEGLNKEAMAEALDDADKNAEAENAAAPVGEITEAQVMAYLAKLEVEEAFALISKVFPDYAVEVDNK